jgi:hypothetical protein
LVFADNAHILHQKSLFSAPEILMQEDFGPAADVWSLGQLCVLLSSGSLVCCSDFPCSIQSLQKFQQDDGLWNQSIPESASYELRDLIDGLTQAVSLVTHRNRQLTLPRMLPIEPHYIEFFPTRFSTQPCQPIISPIFLAPDHVDVPSQRNMRLTVEESFLAP